MATLHDATIIINPYIFHSNSRETDKETERLCEELKCIALLYDIAAHIVSFVIFSCALAHYRDFPSSQLLKCISLLPKDFALLRLSARRRRCAVIPRSRCMWWYHSNRRCNAPATSAFFTIKYLPYLQRLTFRWYILIYKNTELEIDIIVNK